MEITRFMNPNRKNVETKSFLPAGIRIRDIDQRVLNTEEKYIGIVDENGEMLGAIQVERLRFNLSVEPDAGYGLRFWSI